MKKKNKDFDPLKSTIDVGTLSAGTLLAGGMPSMIGRNMPGTCNTLNSINKTTGKTLPLIPMTAGVGTLFKNMDMLEKPLKKNKRKYDQKDFFEF